MCSVTAEASGKCSPQQERNLEAQGAGLGDRMRPVGDESPALPTCRNSCRPAAEGAKAGRADNRAMEDQGLVTALSPTDSLCDPGQRGSPLWASVPPDAQGKD